jgi:hypothetical protein
VLEIIAFAVSAVFLLLILGLATIAFRGGERAGYHETAEAPSGDGATAVRRRTRINPINQLLVWGLSLTLMAATVAMLAASFVWDSWVWH